MGSMVRLFLGVLLILNSSRFLESADVNAANSDNESKEKSIETKNISASNISAENVTTNDKPKTDVNNGSEPIDRRNNLVTDKQDDIKLKPKKIEQPSVIQDGVSAQDRENTARRIDVDRYTSKDFQNRVYTLPISPDTEKFVDSDDYGDRHRPEDHDFQTFYSDLTTPETALFDSRYKEAVKNVDQTLDHIDEAASSESSSTESKEVDVEKLYNETRKDGNNAQLDYVNYRKIVSNDTEGKNSLHSDVTEEAGTNLDFESAYNDTKIIDEKDEDEDKATPRTLAIATTLKTITKPTFTSNSSHVAIFNNKIELDSSHSKPVEITTKTAKSTTNSRGTVKFSDYATTTPVTLIRSTTLKSPNGSEQLVQENQIVPVQVEPPEIDLNSTNSEEEEEITTKGEDFDITTVANVTETTTENVGTTEEAPTTSGTISTKLPGVTTVPNETTTAEIGTTTIESTEENSTEVTTVAVTTTTEETTEVPEVTTKVPEETTKMSEETTKTSEETTKVSEETTEMPEETTEVSEETTEVSEEPTTTETAIPTTTTTEEATTIAETTSSSPGRTSKGFAFETTTKTDSNRTSPMSEMPISTTLRIGTNFSTSTVMAEPEVVQTTDGSVDYEEYEDRGGRKSSTPVEDVAAPSERGYRDFNYTTASESNTTPDGGSSGDNGGTIAAITISTIGAVCLILLAGLLVIMRKRQKRFNYGQRCRPVNLDDYSMDNVSVYNSVRRKPALRSSKRSYGNPAFDDPTSVSHPLNLLALKNFADNREDIKAEFEEIPQIIAKTTELPEGCDTKNRYANVIPLPETRVFLKFIDGYANSDYINANYVTGPKNTRGYYVACQAPMQSTVDDFWRMIWEQESKVILMLTHLFENGVEKCVDYLPPSEVLDCHRLFGDFQVTLKKREVKEKYIISILQLKNMVSNSWREITHFWYLGWPERGVPQEANSLIAFLIEARSYMKSSTIDKKEVTNGAVSNGKSKTETNPVVVHCSPGTGRTGVVIACDIGIREFEQTRLVDVPRIVNRIRRDRAGAVQTKDQYAFIYKVISVYATKLTEVS